MRLHPIEEAIANPLMAPAGSRVSMMGNEAIARGALEGGVYLVTGYPGTPSSEVIMTLQRYCKGLDIYVEWAVNERVAFEIAYGAAIGGTRSLVTMKAPGLNVALDPIVSAAYGGVNGGLVILVADDPGPHTTQTEQDSRWAANLAKLPLISPSNPQEAKDFTAAALELSEQVSLPVILRTTTRVNHTIADVVLGKVREPVKRGLFKRDPTRFVRAGMTWNLERHKWLNKQLRQLVSMCGDVIREGKIVGKGDLCVITEGIAFEYLMEIINGVNGLTDIIKVIKLNILYPLPKDFIIKSVRNCRKILVIEELDPYLELGIKGVIHSEGLNLSVIGKEEGILPLEGELSTNLVASALLKFLQDEGVRSDVVNDIRKFVDTRNAYLPSEGDYIVPPRPPPLCPGCPHRAAYIAIKEGIKRAGYDVNEVPIIGDIGCYALSVNPPLNAIWVEHSMGASISIAAGLKLGGFKGKVIATIGDSTFFHGGIQPIIEAFHKGVDMLVVILDNKVVAMTGHQSTPSWDVTETGRRSRPVDIVNIVKGIGIKDVYIVDPYDVDRLSEVIAECLKKDGVKVVVASRQCSLVAKRRGAVRVKYEVIGDLCVGCGSCIESTGCPAIYLGDDGKAHISIEDCVGCGLCSRFCKFNAIRIRGEYGE